MFHLNKIDLIAYSNAFVSFILKPLEKFEIREIILFGSVARGEFDKNSDIDIFIDIQNEKDSEKINGAISIQLKKFYKSKIREVWLNKGITNEIKVKVGDLDKWKLKRSIISDGITLFGKYKGLPKRVEQYYIFVIKPIPNITKRNKVIRELFGRKENNYHKKGLIEQFNGKRLSPVSFIVPVKSSNEIFSIFKKEKIDYRFYEIWSDHFL